jgi:hypothetical protein
MRVVHRADMGTRDQSCKAGSKLHGSMKVEGKHERCRCAKALQRAIASAVFRPGQAGLRRLGMESTLNLCKCVIAVNGASTHRRV